MPDMWNVAIQAVSRRQVLPRANRVGDEDNSGRKSETQRHQGWKIMGQPHAYLLLIVDTRAPEAMASAIGDTGFRRLSCDIFGEASPTLPGYCYGITLITASGPDYEECHASVLAMVDDPSPLNVFAWCRPLLSERARR